MQFWLDYDEDAMRDSYREQKAKEQAKPKFRRDKLKALGYSEREIEEIAGRE